MRVLEAFKGTGSVSKYCEQLGYEVVSLDIDPNSKATHTIDILKWDYKQYPQGYFDIIWASPPCEQYSTMHFRSPRNLQLADSIVKKTLEIIDYFKPKYWYLENPANGMLRNREFMQNLECQCYIVSYCRYGFPYQKHTRIWSNISNFQPKRCRFDCNSLNEQGRHRGLVLKTKNLNMKHSIPQGLIADLLHMAI